MKKLICFDMDGTIADLYAVDNWLNKLRASDPSPYAEAEPMWDMTKLVNALNTLRQNEYEVVVITWLSKESTAEYDKAVREAKQEWLNSYNFPCDYFHGVKYGTTKASTIRKYMNAYEKAYLFDDNAQIRKGWHLGEAIDPTCEDIVEFLENLL